MFVVLCMHMYSFAGLIRRTPPPTFSDTAITNRHSDTSIFQFRAHWVRISWYIGSEKSFGHVPPLGVEPSTSCVQGKHPIHLARLSAGNILSFTAALYVMGKVLSDELMCMPSCQQGPVVQSIVSITSSLRGQLVKCFMTI